MLQCFTELGESESSMGFAFLFLGYKIFFFHGGKDNTSMSSKILLSNIFGNNLLNLPLDYLESITVFV